MASGDTKTEAMLRILGNGGSADAYRGCCNTKTQSYILDAIDRIEDVEEEVEELKNNPDVVDIVATYADLQSYDTQHLTNNDVIRVLADETHDNQSTYYRFTKNPDTWTYIGPVGDYYTKSQTDVLLSSKQNTLTAGANVTISNNVISATDTTYSDFVGTDGTTVGVAGLVPAPATTDAGKFLKADGTWDEAGSSYDPTISNNTLYL